MTDTTEILVERSELHVDISVEDNNPKVEVTVLPPETEASIQVEQQNELVVVQTEREVNEVLVETEIQSQVVNITVDAGPAGPQGAPGVDGIDGADGLSAYQIALANGFVGTQSEWLNSLAGSDGVGVPSGGDLGQVLAKKSNTDFDTEWIDPPSVGVGGIVRLVREDLTNQIDGLASTFTLANLFTAGGLIVYWNGLLQSRTEYTEDVLNHSFELNVIPQVGDSLVVFVSADESGSIAWDDVTNKPTVFPPDLTNTNLADLANVDSTAPTDGQVLTWDSATSSWKPETPATGSGSGDMAKSVYDTDNDGSVEEADHADSADNASALENHPASYFSESTHVHDVFDMSAQGVADGSILTSDGGMVGAISDPDANGIMLKNYYDSDNDHIVDNSEALEGHPASYFSQANHGHDVLDLTAVGPDDDALLIASGGMVGSVNDPDTIGIMTKAHYDTDADGVVDNSEALEGHPASYFSPADHTHEVGDIPDPAASVVSETSWGVSPAVGTSLQYARADHTHGTPAEPTSTSGSVSLFELWLKG